MDIEQNTVEWWMGHWRHQEKKFKNNFPNNIKMKMQHTKNYKIQWKLIPNFLRNCHTDFQSGCTSLQSHQQWMSVPLTPHPLQHKLSLVFLILALVTGVRGFLRVVLICISLMAKDVEQFLKCCLVICKSSVENSLFWSVLHL